jgi:hypothetical protein
MVDANTEISDMDRKLMVRNKGCPIFVSNSLIKPDIFRYSTKVSDAMANVFHSMHNDKLNTTAEVNLEQEDDNLSLNFNDHIDYEVDMDIKESKAKLL